MNVLPFFFMSLALKTSILKIKKCYFFHLVNIHINGVSLFNVCVKDKKDLKKLLV